MNTLILATLMVALTVPAAAPSSAADLRVGVTLHPYYSWTRNIVRGTDVEVRSILPGAVDAGSYQPSPGEIEKLVDLDAIVINGLGHDDFILGMIRASGNASVRIIRPNTGTPLIQSAGGRAVNSHTFISFTNAIQQTYLIERELAGLAPQHAALFRVNARDYARRLRAIKTKAAIRLVAPRSPRVVTVHDGYSYLLQEFGIECAGVVEPSHGLVPSAAELQAVVSLLRRREVRVIFTEERFPEPLLRVLTDATPASVHVLSHVATGPYTDDKFETEMAANAEVLVGALADPE